MLTVLGIRSAVATGRRVEIWDGKLPGFGLRVSPTGTKSFVLMYYAGGRKRRLTLGRYPVMELAPARRLALQALAAVANGSDPKGDGAASTKQYQFSKVAGEFVKLYCQRHNRERYAREVDRILRRHFVSVWGERDVRKIGRGDVVEILDAVVKAGTPIMANAALAAVRKFFSWALEREFVAANPCSGIGRPAPAVTRERVLSQEEIAAVWHAALDMPTPISQIVRLLLLTGQRRGEVAAIKWKEIDWEACSWTIPVIRAKTKRPHMVPLSSAALCLLKSIPQTHQELVFPGPRGLPLASSSFQDWKRKIDTASRVSGWTLHDLRRTAATHMAGLGVAPHVIERILNHSKGILGGVAGTYNRFQYIPEMRDALELWATRIGELTHPGPCAGLGTTESQPIEERG